MSDREKENPGGVVDGVATAVPAGVPVDVPAGGPSIPTVLPAPAASDLLVIGGVAQTRGAIVAAHQPDAVGESCRSCGHVYGEVRVCPAAAEALEGCAALVSPASAGPVEIVHVVCGRRPRRLSGWLGWALTVFVVLLVAGQLVSTLLPLPVVVHLVVAVATPVCVWCLAVVIRRISRRERDARRNDALEPLV